MHDRLTSRLPIIDAHVEARRIVTAHEFAATPVKKSEKLGSLFSRGFEERHNVAPRDNQRVARRNGISVKKDEAVRAAL